MLAPLCLLAVVIVATVTGDQVVTVTKGNLDMEYALQKRLILYLPDGRCHAEATVKDFNCAPEDVWDKKACTLSVTVHDGVSPASLDVADSLRRVTVARQRDENDTCPGVAVAVVSTACPTVWG